MNTSLEEAAGLTRCHLPMWCFAAATLVFLLFASSCGEARPRASSLLSDSCDRRIGVMRITYKCDDPDDWFYRSFGARSVDRGGPPSSEFELGFDHGRLRSGFAAAVELDGSAGVLAAKKTGGSSVWFRRSYVGTHDVYGDDGVAWSCALSWAGPAEGLLAGETKSISLALVYDGSSPPHARLEVGSLDGIEVRRVSDGVMALRASFRVIDPQAAFPRGRGTVLAVLPMTGE